MQFEFNISNQTVTFMEDDNLIGIFDISSLNAWQIRWYTSGQNLASSYTSTAKVYISLFQTSAVQGNISIIPGQTLNGSPIDLTSIVTTNNTINQWYTVTEVGGCDVEPDGTYFAAENFTDTIIQGTSTFIPGTSQGGYLGTSYLVSNGDTSSDSCPASDEGKDYQLNFTSTGTYKAWVRGYATGEPDNSIFIGIDETCLGVIRTDTFNQWSWTTTPQSGGNTFTISSTGLHAFNIWIRDNGFLTDGIYITQDVETPTDSTHGTETYPNNCNSTPFSDNETAASSLDTTLWTDGEKTLEVTGDDAICNLPLTPANDTFNFVY